MSTYEHADQIQAMQNAIFLMSSAFIQLSTYGEETAIAEARTNIRMLELGAPEVRELDWLTDRLQQIVIDLSCEMRIYPCIAN